MSILDWRDPARVRALLDAARDEALRFIEELPSRPVRASASIDELRASLGVPLPEALADPVETFESFIRSMDRGIVASAGPRYFGFVIGGSVPISLAADWMVSTWDQNPGLYATSPATSVAEETAARWVLDLLGLPPSSGVGFVTGCQMANFTALAAARHAVLERAGWDVEQDGLQGAPKVHVVMGDEAHVTIHTALRYLGLGLRTARLVPCDDQGRMRPDALERALADVDGPAIVCAQVGNVNTGAIDPVPEIAAIAHQHGAWLHLDGAFGLWAAASPARRSLVDGIDRADSWATDAHKWLNVPYDCGLVIVKDAAAHRAAMSVKASYLEQSAGAERDELDWVPEFSRRGRSVPVYAALLALGRTGVAEIIDRGCDMAARIAGRLDREDGIRILNEVVLNQVLVRFGEDDEATREVVRRVQSDGTCWLAGTTWKEMAAMRISVSNWSTDEEAIDRSADAIIRAAREVLAGTSVL
ncbi:MAG TPA: aspartate aminotransferase family protein [Thermoanaerobaculia bacterium]|nr:aspartate aminotransferase family protein [Thermoanaerobaculia bacterium]